MNKLFAGPFRDRIEAGRDLAGQLIHYKDHSRNLVLGIPRAGIPVAVSVARHLNAPLDAFVIRKLTVPNRAAVTMGVIASGGLEYWNERVVREHRVTAGMIETSIEHEEGELRRRERIYRGLREMPRIGGQVAILVDDGLSTGRTMQDAVRVLRQGQPSRIVVAAPVGSRQAIEVVRDEADEVVCGVVTDDLHSVDRWYRDNSPLMDREIRELLDQAVESHAGSHMLAAIH